MQCIDECVKPLIFQFMKKIFAFLGMKYDYLFNFETFPWLHTFFICQLLRFKMHFEGKNSYSVMLNKNNKIFYLHNDLKSSFIWTISMIIHFTKHYCNVKVLFM